MIHRSTLLLNLNCADNVPNIEFNAAADTNKLDVFILPWHDVISRQRKQTFGFALFDNFI